MTFSLEKRPLFRVRVMVVCVVFAWLLAGRPPGQGVAAQAQSGGEFNDSHFHLTNYIQQGITAREFLAIMGNRVGRSTLFGIPLQQHWSFANSGEFAPTYYLQSDAPLYYYSFTDAYIAAAYRALSAADQARFDPMITGFNPADMYAVDHIRRVLTTFPGVFSGIGEFSIHKEFVSAKIPGETASLTEPRARPGPRSCRRGRARRDPPQRHRHAVRQGGSRAGLLVASQGAAQTPPEDDHHLGPHRVWAESSSPSR